MSEQTKKKKILFVTRPLSPPWDEASKNFAFDLAKNLRDVHVTILVDTLIDDLPAHITQEMIYTNNHLSFVQKIRLLFFLLMHAKDFDMIHLLFTPTKLNSTLMRLILPKNGVKVVQTIATVRDDLYMERELKQMFFGDVLVTYSKWAEKKLKSLGYTNVLQVYPGIDLEKYTPQEKDMSLMEQWQIPPKNTIITYPGEYTRLGATDLIADAFIALWRDPKYHSVTYLCNCRVKNDADAQKKEELKKRFADAGHADKVVFTDTVTDMNAVYNLSDIVIFPVTNMHGKFDVPLAMIEPYACKKPVIASDLGLFQEFSGPKINAIIPTANVDALKDMIAELIADPDRRRELGENAYAFAHETFNIERIAQSYEDIYAQI